jgi:hypothetical protein
MSTRTLAEIKRDFQSYKALAKKQQGVTLYAEKYVEDVGALLDMIPQAKDDVAPTRRSSEKAKAPKAE